MSRMTEILTLDRVVAWVETQPPETAIRFSDGYGCIIYRFLKAKGQPVSSVGGYTWIDKRRREHPITEPLQSLVMTDSYVTFLDQARAWRARQGND